MRIAPKQIIRTYKHTGSVSTTAQLLGISRMSVYRWLDRARTARGTYSERHLHRFSTRPKTIQCRLTLQEQSAIMKLRKETGYAAIKLKEALGLPAHVSTIHRFLKHKGMLNGTKHHRRPHYQPTTHMHLKNTTSIGKLQMDVKYFTPELTGLPYTCFEYAVIDIYSRYKDAVILNQLNEDGAILALMEIRARLPFVPDFIQTDNGLEFQSRFHAYCEKSGLAHHHIHKSTPNENAVIERSFRTDEEEFFFRLEQPPKDYDELRVQFASFLSWYNTKRLHLGIQLKTPQEVVRLSHMS